MKRGARTHRFLLHAVAGLCVLVGVSRLAEGQSTASPKKTETAVPPVSTLEQDFFAAIRTGDSKKFLSYVPDRGLNVGPQAQHASQEEIQQQFASHRGIYCKLFDSSCIDSPLKLDNSARTCSYRDLLTHSKKVRTAGTETTRNGVQQAILVAEVKSDQCPQQELIDFIFNLEADGWKLFSLP